MQCAAMKPEPPVTRTVAIGAAYAPDLSVPPLAARRRGCCLPDAGRLGLVRSPTPSAPHRRAVPASKTAQVLGIERTDLHKKQRALGNHRGEESKDE